MNVNGDHAKWRSYSFLVEYIINVKQQFVYK